eukprot:tig00020571_g11480.t1
MPRFVFVKKQVVQAPQYGVEPISLTVGRPQVRSGSVLNNGGGTFGFQMNWVAVTDAVKYNVYRAPSLNGTWTLVATVNAPTLTYTNSPFNFGELRLYRVAAVREQGSSSTGSDGKVPPTTYAQSLLYTHEGARSNYIQFQGIGGSTPTIEAYTALTTATAQTYGDFIAGGRPASAGFPKPTFVVTINWVAMEGADSIRIYRDGTPIGFASSALSTSYIDDSTALAWGTEYSYQVAGIVGGVEYEKSDPLLVWTMPNAPTNVTASAPNDEQQPVSLSWTAPTGATGYKIYRDGAYLADSATNSYSDATTVWGTGYEYQVSATNSGGEGPKSIATYVTTDPAAPATISTAQPSAASPNVTVTWTAPATGTATSYNVYRGSTKVGHNVSSPFTDSATLFITEYSYTVKAVNIVGEEGPASSSSAITCYSQNAKQLKAVNTALGDGTYKFRLADGTLLDIYCDMTIRGGGWMSFAAQPSSGAMYAGDTGDASWTSTAPSYAYGTYLANGTVPSTSGYWRNYTLQAGPSRSELLFKTGNGTYWISFPLSEMVRGSEFPGRTVTLTASSGGLGSEDRNTKANVLFRAATITDPWVTASSSHDTERVFWGEAAYSQGAANLTWKNNNQGIIVFVR